MVLLPDGRQKIRAKARAEGFAEGFAKSKSEGYAEGFTQGWAIGFTQGLAEGISMGTARVNAVWKRWNARRLESKARDEPFDEPPPDYAGYPSGDEPKRGD